MKNLIVSAFVFILCINSIKASFQEENPVLLTINGRDITLADFQYVYSKNNLNTQVIDPKTAEEYLELFVNFNLKVAEAIELGLDTFQSFKDELAGYRKQLAQPYLSDARVTTELLEEAYQRMQYDIRASHILISVDEHASPADTLAAWKKITDIRKRLMAGEKFEDLAFDLSDDPSASGMPASANRPPMRPNYGDLGYFSVLDMVYPFENAAYNIEVNEISQPVRSNFGYHLIKVTDRLPAMGRARVAHIMVNAAAEAPQDEIDEAKRKIDELYNKILSGESFDELAFRHSDDRSSARRNGEMTAFTSNRMVPEFIKAIADLNEPEQISPPVRTKFGWHIIKFLEKELPSESEAKSILQNRIQRDSRAQLSQQSVIHQLKNQYNFIENPQTLDIFYNIVDDRIFLGNWSADYQPLDKIMFSFAGNKFTQEHFANFLMDQQILRSPEPIRNFVNAKYVEYQKQLLLEHEEQLLDEKYPEFKKIMQEYHDGILLFELTDQKVWSKAMSDTVGLQQFYKQNIQNYVWDDRIDGVVFAFDSEDLANSARKQIRRSQRKKLDHNEIVKQFNTNSTLNVSAEKGRFSAEEKPLLQNIRWRKGVSNPFEWNGRFFVVQIDQILPSQPKKLNEIRGLVIADYQNHLEANWINELREKFPVKVNAEVLQLLQAD